MTSEMDYPFPRSNDETERLVRQSRMYAEMTRSLFREAGIGPGMKVLDVGSGAGDVAFIASELVGAEGEVIGIDIDPQPIKGARERAEAAGLKNVRFISGDPLEADLPCEFDAIVGRLVLIYMPDIPAALKRFQSLLRTDGILAFIDTDLRLYQHLTVHEDTPLQQWIFDCIFQAFRSVGAQQELGMELPRHFVAAGLPYPAMRLEAPIGCGQDWAGYQWLADACQNFLPIFQRLGITTAEEMDLDTLPQRLRDEAESSKRPLIMIPAFSAWTRLSAA